jgi:mycothiol synthase
MASPPPDQVELRDSRGTPVVQFRWRDDDGERVVSQLRPLPGVSPDQAARQVVPDLAGRRITTADEPLARALIGAGCTLERAATDMERDLSGPLPVAAPAAGWALIPHDWDDDLARALAAAYGPGHPDQGDRVTRLQSLLNSDRGLVLIPGASARLRDPDGRSAGEVVTVGPVPWASAPTSWVLDLAVAPAAQGRGSGAALLAYAMSGTRDAGLTTAGLTVTDGNPARRLYDRLGFRPVMRHFSVRAPVIR